MSDPLLDKMDALLKKHQGVVEAPPAPKTEPLPAAEPNAPPPLPEDAWLPVLTDVVAVGEPSAATAEPAPPAAEPGPPPPPAPTVDPAMLIEEIMSGLEPRLSSLLIDRLTAEVRNSLDESMSSLIAQMDVHIREIVREAVNEQLGKS
jgi:hypothetical protein